MPESIGRQLKRERETRHLSLERVTEVTRIRSHYLEALEADDYTALPSPVQARGFLRIYAEFLGVSLEDLYARARQEEIQSPAPAVEAIAAPRLEEPPAEVVEPPATPPIESPTPVAETAAAPVEEPTPEPETASPPAYETIRTYPEISIEPETSEETNREYQPPLLPLESKPTPIPTREPVHESAPPARKPGEKKTLAKASPPKTSAKQAKKPASTASAKGKAGKEKVQAAPASRKESTAKKTATKAPAKKEAGKKPASAPSAKAKATTAKPKAAVVQAEKPAKSKAAPAAGKGRAAKEKAAPAPTAKKTAAGKPAGKSAKPTAADRKTAVSARGTSPQHKPAAKARKAPPKTTPTTKPTSRGKTAVPAAKKAGAVSAKRKVAPVTDSQTKTDADRHRIEEPRIVAPTPLGTPAVETLPAAFPPVEVERAPVAPVVEESAQPESGSGFETPPERLAPLPDETSPAAGITAQMIFDSIGAQLRQRRELLSLNLDEIERHTHVRRRYLEALEDGRFNDLPSSVQARGMLNNYTAFLDLDVDAVLLRFAEALQLQRLERLPQQAEESSAENNPPKKDLPPSIRRHISADLIFVILFFIVILAFVGWGFSRVLAAQSASSAGPTLPSRSEELAAPTSSPEEMIVETAVPITATLAAPTIDQTAAVSIPPTEVGAIQLIVSAIGQAYMKVTVDEEIVFEGRVIPGNFYPYSGERQIEILTGNGAALNIVYQQNDLGPMGSNGQMVNLIYTPNEILFPTPTPTPTPTITPTPTRTPRFSPTPRSTPTTRPAP